MRRRASQQDRTSERGRCAACGRVIALGAEPLAWAILGDRALVHLVCIDAYGAGMRMMESEDLF